MDSEEGSYGLIVQMIAPVIPPGRSVLAHAIAEAAAEPEALNGTTRRHRRTPTGRFVSVRVKTSAPTLLTGAQLRSVGPQAGDAPEQPSAR